MSSAASSKSSERPGPKALPAPIFRVQSAGRNSTIEMLKLSTRGAPLIVLFGTFAAGAAMAFPPDPDLPPNTADWFRAFVGDQYTYDNNLFRLPSSSTPGYQQDVATLIPPGTSLQDHINTQFAGFDGNWIAGRQTVDYDLEIDYNRFERNDYLDNTSGTAKAVWNWSVESNLSGQLGGDYTRALTGYANTFYFAQDIVDRQEYFGNGRYQIGPRWAVYGSLNDADTKNSAANVQFNNFDLQSGKVGMEFATSLENSIGVEYRYSHGHYPDTVFTDGVPVNPNYNENTIVFVAKYLVSDKTTLSGDAGYLKRSYPNDNNAGAFSGDTWHAKLQWQPTEKTGVLVTAGRDLQAYFYAQSDYFVQDGISIAPTWYQSDKFTWTALASWYRQNYISTSTSVLVLGSRRDNLSAEQISLTYTPFRWLLFNVLYHHEVRSSTQPLLGYDDDIAQAGVKLRF
jgi:hypothetical protein